MNYHPDFVNKYTFDDVRMIQIDIKGVSFIFQVFQNISSKRFNEKKCKKVLKEFVDIIEKYPKNTITKINIVVYDIPMKKELPLKKEYIEPKHINSGYCFPYSTVNDTNIVIFRREEFYKVLIHELLHFFNIIPYNQDLQTEYAKKFSSVPSININEAIVELHAIHINCEIISKIKNKSFEQLIEFEYDFSITQCKKLLKQQDAEFSDIMENSFTWNETTNAFSYFILKHIFFHLILKKPFHELHNEFNKKTASSKIKSIRLSKNLI
jgi:hypothetical protein